MGRGSAGSDVDGGGSPLAGSTPPGAAESPEGRAGAPRGAAEDDIGRETAGHPPPRARSPLAPRAETTRRGDGGAPVGVAVGTGARRFEATGDRARRETLVETPRRRRRRDARCRFARAAVDSSSSFSADDPLRDASIGAIRARREGRTGAARRLPPRLRLAPSLHPRASLSRAFAAAMLRSPDPKARAPRETASAASARAFARVARIVDHNRPLAGLALIMLVGLLVTGVATTRTASAMIRGAPRGAGGVSRVVVAPGGDANDRRSDAPPKAPSSSADNNATASASADAKDERPPAKATTPEASSESASSEPASSSESASSEPASSESDPSEGDPSRSSSTRNVGKKDGRDSAFDVRRVRRVVGFILVLPDRPPPRPHADVARRPRAAHVLRRVRVRHLGGPVRARVQEIHPRDDRRRDRLGTRRARVPLEGPPARPGDGGGEAHPRRVRGGVPVPPHRDDLHQRREEPERLRRAEAAHREGGVRAEGGVLDHRCGGVRPLPRRG